MIVQEGKFYRTRDGRKVGPAVAKMFDLWDLGDEFTLLHDADGSFVTGEPSEHDLIAEWTEGPVRTVTRREVVEGSYGRLVVCPHEPGTVLVGFEHPCDLTFVSLTATELKAAAAVLLELAGALDSE